MSEEYDMDDYLMYVDFCEELGADPWPYEADFRLHWSQLELGY